MKRIFRHDVSADDLRGNWVRNGIMVILACLTSCQLPQRNPPSRAELLNIAAESLATQLSAKLATNQRLRVGFLPVEEEPLTFSQDNQEGISVVYHRKVDRPPGKVLQELLKTRLFATKRFDMIEDTDMVKVLDELRNQELKEAIFKPDTIHRVGALLGADAILVGTISSVGSHDFIITYRLVPVSSGVIKSAAEFTINWGSPYSQ